MKNIIFASILEPDTAYTIHDCSSDLWDTYYRTTRPLNCHIGTFRTFGDGLTQHSGESVATAWSGLMAALDMIDSRNNARNLFRCAHSNSQRQLQQAA